MTMTTVDMRTFIASMITLALACGVAAATSAVKADAVIYPGSRAPGALRVQTLTGEFVFNPKEHKAPIIIMAYSSNNAALRNMWHSNESLQAFLAPATPNDTQFLFMSYAAAAREDVLGLAERLGTALQGLPEELRAVRRRQLHFATAPLPSLQGTSWLPRLLDAWRSPRRILHVQTSEGNWALVAPRLDGRYAVVRSPEGLKGLHVVSVKDACSLPDPPETDAVSSSPASTTSGTRLTHGMAAALAAQRHPAAGQAAATHSGAASMSQRGLKTAAVSMDSAVDGYVRGTAALVVQDQGSPLKCSYPQLLRKLGHAGAASAIIGSVPGSDVTEIQCRGEECDWAITVPASMITHEDAQKIATAIDWFEQAALDAGTRQRVVADFQTEQVAGNFAGIDAAGRVVELGWQVFPTLKQLAWGAQWLGFQAELAANLSRPALVVPVFEPQLLPEPGDLHVNVTMPAAKRLAGLDTLELDFSLSCPGHFDADCPQWDHVLQLHACCGASCRPCRPLVWLQGHGSGAGSNASTAAGAGASSGHCGAELGRWITPFRRRGGRWLTDVSELRPLLKPGASCRFTLQAPPWAPGWKPALNLRFLSSHRHQTGSTILPEPGRRLPKQTALHLGSPEGLDSGSRHTGRALLGPLAMQLSAARRRRWRREHSRSQAPQHAASPTGNPLASHARAAAAVRSFSSDAGAAASNPAAGALVQLSRGGQEQKDWRAKQLRPFHVLPLWEGGTFDERYNLGRSSINFTAPAGTRRVLLEAVITGHGYDLVNPQCAEFCVTSHHFVVNGAEHSVTYEEAGTQWGCADKVRSGSMPNEHGTWQFGRMGWCDGQEVRPWVADVTADVRLAGIGRAAGDTSSRSNSANTISYRGLFEGQDPQPSDTAGYIMMESNLVFLRDDS